MISKIKLVVSSISTVASVACFFAGFALHNVGLSVTGILSAVGNIMYLSENIKGVK